MTVTGQGRQMRRSQNPAIANIGMNSIEFHISQNVFRKWRRTPLHPPGTRETLPQQGGKRKGRV